LLARRHEPSATTCQKKGSVFDRETIQWLQFSYPGQIAIVHRKLIKRLGTGMMACIAFMAGPSRVHAVEFQPLGEERGLDAKIVSSLLIDRHGFLWAASREGLYRYDGYGADRFMPDGKPGSITDADIRMIHEARDGRIWVATNNGGLNVFDPETGRFSAYRHRSDDIKSLSNDSVYGMAEAGGGRLWVGTQIGLNRLDLASGTVERYLHDPEDPRSISNDYIFEVYRDSADVVWITTIGGGLNRWNEASGNFDRFDLAALTRRPESLNDIFAVAESADGVLWFGTRGGLARLDVSRKSFDYVDLEGNAGSDSTITSLLFDEKQNLWISLLSGGVLVYEPATGLARPANPGPPGSAGQLPAVPQISLALAQDLLFVGTWGSGVYAGRIGQITTSLLAEGAEKSGLTSANVTSVLAGQADGRPLVGMFNGNLEQGNFVAGSGPVSAGVLAGFSSGALAIERMPDQSLFVGLMEGLLELSGDLSSSTLHRHDPAATGSLGPGFVTSLEAEAGGALWVGVGGSGLFLYRPAEGTFTAYAHNPENPQSLGGNYITSLLQSGDNELWVGTRSHGLDRCRISPWACEHFVPDPGDPKSLGHFHVTSIYRDRDDNIWVTTSGGGLHRVNLAGDGRVTGFTRWTRRDGLISDDTMAVLEDDDDTLWISSREGLSRLQTDSGQFSNLIEVSAGLSASSFNTNAASRDGRFLYFGTLSGLLGVPVGQPFEPRSPAPIGLTRFERTAGKDRESTRSAHPGSMVIDYGELVSVGFAVLDFAEVPHEYEYRVDGAPDWVGLGSRQEITFSGLSPGSHLVRVRGRDVFGLWSEAAPFSIEVIPPFWMTTWFRLLIVASIVVLSLSAHQARMRGLQRRNQQLQALQASREAALERAEKSKALMEEAFAGMRNLTARLELAKEQERLVLARELHDELGQMLTAAKINLQIAGRNPADAANGKRLQDSVDMIDQMIRQVRDISLSLRPPLLDAAGLVPALEYFLGALEKRSGIPIRLDAEDAGKGASPEVRTTVFRIIQEAVNNAIRHASASSIHVSLRTRGSSIEISIRDDGCGFDAGAIEQRIRRGEHLGLLGMYERVLGAGGSFRLESEPGEGCVIHATVPV